MSIKLPDHEMTHAEELQYADYYTRMFLNKIAKLNAKCKHIQITDVKININEPSKVKGRNIFQRMFGKKEPTPEIESKDLLKKV